MKLFERIANQYRLYKIIPHQSTLNQTTRKLLGSLHNIFSMYDNPRSRITWDRGINYRGKDAIYWFVQIAGGQGEEPAKVEFYIAVSDIFADVFLTKLNNHDQWRKSTVEQVDHDVMQLPLAADTYRLKYTRSDMFSLSYDLNRQTVPIREIVNVSQEVGPGESADLVVRFETVSRRKWKSLSDYAWSVWEQGKVPQRNGINFGQLASGFGRLACSITNEIKGLLGDIIYGIENSFFADAKPRMQEKIELPDREREELLINGDLSPQTKRKRNLPVWKTGIYAIVNAETQERKGMLARSLAGAFGELNGDNQLLPFKLNIKYDGWQKLPRDRDGMLMSTEELGKVMMLPTREVQEEYKENLHYNRKIEIDIPDSFTREGIYMGDATNKGQKIPIYLPTDNTDMLMTARAFIGSPRMGKDQAVINMVVEAKLKYGIGAVVPDVIDERNGHRGMADALRDHLPPDDVIDINLGDYEWPVWIGLQGITQGMANRRIANNRIAQELTNFLMGDDIANHQTREYLREAAKITGGDLLGIKLMFTSQEYRQTIISAPENAEFDTSLWQDYDQLSDGKQGQIYGPILVRLGELLGDEFLKPIFGQQPNQEINLAKWMQDGKVVIYRIPSRDLGEMAVQTLTHWIVLTTFLTKLSIGGVGAATWLVLNEPHQFLSPGLIHFCKRLLAEGPKYRISPLFLFHNFKQLPSDFVEILLSSSLNWHIFKNTNDSVYQRLENYLYPTFTTETAMQGTARFQYVASWLDGKGEYREPFLVNAPDLVGNRYESQDNSFLTKRHSRIYGRQIADVLAEMKEKERQMFRKKA